MASFKITFPDGTQKEFVHPVSARELIQYLPALPSPIVGIKVNNLVVPLNKTIDVQSKIEPVTLADREG